MKSSVPRPHRAPRVLASKLTTIVTLVLLACFQPATAQNAPTVISVPVPTATPAETHAPFPVGNKLSRNLQKYTGINLLSEMVAGKVAAVVIKSKVGGRVKVRVHIYSFTDLLAGKLKSLEVKMSGSSYRGIPLGDVTLASTNPLWYRPFKSRKLQVGLQTPLLVRVDGRINEDLISQALQDPRIASLYHLAKFDLPGLGMQQVEFVQPRVSFKNGKINLSSTFITPGASPDTGVEINMVGTPYLDDSKILVRELQVSSPDIVDPTAFSQFVQQMANPIVNLARLDRRNHAFRLDNLMVQDNGVEFGGKLLMAPRTVAIGSR